MPEQTPATVSDFLLSVKNVILETLYRIIALKELPVDLAKEITEFDWDFDCKDSEKEKASEANRNQFGDFNTPIIIKLCSRYKKANPDSEIKLNPVELAT